MIKRGFTFIELIVVMTLGLLLAGVALPRYNRLIIRQEFIADVQKVASCVQGAQSLAAAPVASNFNQISGARDQTARWTMAELKLSSTTPPTFECRVYAFSESTAPTADDLLTTTPALSASILSPTKTAVLAQVGLGQLTVNGTAPFRVYFDAQDRGSVATFVHTDGTLVTRAESGGTKGAYEAPMAASNLPASNGNSRAYLSIPVAGVPIHIR